MSLMLHPLVTPMIRSISKMSEPSKKFSDNRNIPEAVENRHCGAYTDRAGKDEQRSAVVFDDDAENGEVREDGFTHDTACEQRPEHGPARPEE